MAKVKVSSDQEILREAEEVRILQEELVDIRELYRTLLQIIEEHPE